MNRLQKFAEKGKISDRPGRIAYVIKLKFVAYCHDGMRWQYVESFSAANEVLENPGFKTNSQGRDSERLRGCRSEGDD